MTTNPIELQRYLGGVNYPATKDVLVERARDADAPEDVLRTLRALPVDRVETPDDLDAALGRLS